MWILTAWTFSTQGISSLKPGQGWCFPGSKGHLFVYLSHPISITHVTIGHITKSQSPYGHISSAPRTFSVYVSLPFHFIIPHTSSILVIVIHTAPLNVPLMAASGSSAGNEKRRRRRDLFGNDDLWPGRSSVSDPGGAGEYRTINNIRSVYIEDELHPLHPSESSSLSVSHQKPDDTIFSCVRLEVENNWGKKNYTCLYSFRVHGKLWPLFHVWRSHLWRLTSHLEEVGRSEVKCLRPLQVCVGLLQFLPRTPTCQINWCVWV